MRPGLIPARLAVMQVAKVAMLVGPSEIPRIARECDLPVETCRYYLNRMHQRGLRFFAVADYRALGLSYVLAFLELDWEWRGGRREENLVRWLEKIYVTYRAKLDGSGTYFMIVNPPIGEEDDYERLLEALRDLDVLSSFKLYRVVDGAYRPLWLSLYNLLQGGWLESPSDREPPSIPMSVSNSRLPFDGMDLRILATIEIDPRTTNRRISEMTGISPQLISYHRQRHIEKKLITGFVPGFLQEPLDARPAIAVTKGCLNEELARYNHVVFKTEDGLSIYRLILKNQRSLPSHETELLSYIMPYSVQRFAIPIEHYDDEEGRWRNLAIYRENVEQLLKKVQ